MRDQIKEHFRKVDPILYSVVAKVPPVTIGTSDDYFSDLCEAIINQQLSEKAGATIWKRFRSLFPKGKLIPEKLLALPDAKIRSIGTSWSKVTYLKELAKQVSDKTLLLAPLARASDTEVIAKLTKVKGIGPWTAEMFLMFSLGREDVFSYGDMGLRSAIKRLYKLRKDPTKNQLERITRKWSPYRTWAAYLLWRSLEL